MMLNEEAAPLAEALPIAALRGYLRLGTGFALADGASEDAALAGFLRAAIATIEARTGKVLLRRVFRMRLAEWRDAQAQPLPLAPVVSVEAVEITDRMDRATSLSPEHWRLVQDMQRPLLVPAAGCWMPVPVGGGVTVRFVAGFADEWGDVPPDLAQAVLMLAARYYEDRGAAVVSGAALPFGVASLVERWRAVRVLGGRGARA